MVVTLVKTLKLLMEPIQIVYAQPLKILRPIVHVKQNFTQIPERNSNKNVKKNASLTTLKFGLSLMVFPNVLVPTLLKFGVLINVLLHQLELKLLMLKLFLVMIKLRKSMLIKMIVKITVKPILMVNYSSLMLLIIRLANAQLENLHKEQERPPNV